MCAAAREHGLATFLDGARLWNAAIASGRKEAELAAPFDLVARVAVEGSRRAGRLAARRPARARSTSRVRYRRMFGGAMRQSGIYAAAGLYALDHHHARLADDHANARAFAERLAQSPRVAIDLATVQTNIVVFGLADDAPDGAAVVAAARAKGVLVFAFGPRTIRAVTHLDVSRAQCVEAAETLAAIIDGRLSGPGHPGEFDARARGSGTVVDPTEDRGRRMPNCGTLSRGESMVPHRWSSAAARALAACAFAAVALPAQRAADGQRLLDLARELGAADVRGVREGHRHQGQLRALLARARRSRA